MAMQAALPSAISLGIIPGVVRVDVEVVVETEIEVVVVVVVEVEVVVDHEVVVVLQDAGHAKKLGQQVTAHGSARRVRMKQQAYQ